MQPHYPTHPSGIPGGALGSNPPLSPPTLSPTTPLPIDYGGTGASNSLPPGALRFFGTNEANTIAWYKLVPQRVLLASLKPAGVWYPNQFVGPSYSDQSASSVPGYNGSGFARLARAGILSRFAIENALPSGGSSLDMHVYVGPSPSLLSFSGIVITVVLGQYVSENLLDDLQVAADDCVALFNPDLVIGYSPGALSVTADFTAYP